MENTDQVKAGELARGTAKRKATISWSAAVDHRLDQLVARAAGTDPERSDLLAALVAAAPSSGEELDELVSRWRRQKVRDVVLDVPSRSASVHLPRHGPGRRGRG